MSLVMNYGWAMPSGLTFTIKPIKELVERYFDKLDGGVSIDPFARDCLLATYTNDLNPKTMALFHMTALEFLTHMREKGIKPDLILFDPPYSLRQVKEIYNSVGRDFTQHDSQHAVRWDKEKALIAEIIAPHGVVISCGWSANGMGLKNGFQKEEILLIDHGGGHNATIVTVERKALDARQVEMFP